MGSVLILAMAGCLTTFINESGHAWNGNDHKVFQHASKVCATDDRYKGNRCVKVFTKTKIRSYKVLCVPK